MYDPMTVAHEIVWPFKNKHGHKKSLITIWHVDPETDGTDDSCGWFKRAHHGNKEVFEKIVNNFLFNYKHNYWFDANGFRQFSTAGMLLGMYHTALWETFGHNHRKKDKFLRYYLADILHFAENPTDSIGDTITRKHGGDINEETMRFLARVIYGDILRKITPWYKHPRWHIHHWKLKIHWPSFRSKKSNCAGAPASDDNLRSTV